MGIGGDSSGRRSIVDRLSMRVAADAQAPGRPDRAVMARVFAYLYGLGGVLVVLTLLLPHDPSREVAPLLAVALAAWALAAAFVFLYDRMPMPVFRIAPSIGSIMIGVLAYYAGPTGASAYLFFLLWVSLSASYFFPLREALGHALFAIACVVGVLVLRDDVPQASLLAVMVGGTLLVNGALMVALRFQFDLLVENLDRAARTDFLTRLANRREFNERFAYEVARAKRGGHPLSITILDLDAFKRINDLYGHDGGDKALVAFASLLAGGTREVDTAARIGGEEFALITPDTDASAATVLAERVRRKVETEFAAGHGLTVSCGVAELTDIEAGESGMLKAADAALYEAKSSGRNRVVVYTERRAPESSRPEPEIGHGGLTPKPA